MAVCLPGRTGDEVETVCEKMLCPFGMRGGVCVVERGCRGEGEKEKGKEKGKGGGKTPTRHGVSGVSERTDGKGRKKGNREGELECEGKVCEGVGVGREVKAGL